MSSYNNPSWKRKREVIKRRDDYLCQECKRLGITREAEMVHHINPVEIHPEKFLENENLISLCNACHEKMHNRGNGSLTQLGRLYQRGYLMRKGIGGKLAKVVFVTGAPCSGKSTYVRERAGRNDLVYDLDELVKTLTLNPLYDKNPIVVDYVMDIRNLILKRLETETEIDTAWIIVTDVKWIKDKYYFYDVEVVEMTATEEECLKRLDHMDRHDKEEVKLKIKKFFNPPY